MMLCHRVSHDMWKEQQHGSGSPGEPPQGMPVAQAIASGSAETPQDSLEAPAAGQLLRGAGMWPPWSFPPWWEAPTPELQSWEAGWPFLTRQSLSFGTATCCTNRGPRSLLYFFSLFFSTHYSWVIPDVNLALAHIISTVFIMGFLCAQQLDFCLVV